MLKTVKILCLAILIANVTMAQNTNTFPPDGNAGIGTLSPDSKLNVIGEIHSTGMVGSRGTYFNVMKIPALDTSPDYFYMDTNIPANDVPAPQIQITGYMYGSSNKAMKVTLGWYYYQNGFYWTQYQSDLGYNKPARIRLGKYEKNGAYYIRIEIANYSYWANYTVSATDRTDFWSYYTGWTMGVGEMPANTTEITEVAQQKEVAIDGNLGLGTSAPEGRLDVRGVGYFNNTASQNYAAIAVGASGGSYGTVGFGYRFTTSSDSYIYSGPDFASQISFPRGGMQFRTAPMGSINNAVPFTNAMTLLQNGNFGIGTTTPASPLHVTGGIPGTGGWNSTAMLEANYPIQIFNSASGKYAGIGYDRDNGMCLWVNAQNTDVNGSGRLAVMIDNNGSLLIGKTSLTNPSYKLDVNGKARVNEIVVNTSGADFVFGKNYSLRSLPQLEKYIKTNQHLPEIADAQTMQANGMGVGEIQTKLLQKVEELTLYVIELNKKNLKQEKRINALASALRKTKLQTPIKAKKSGLKH